MNDFIAAGFGIAAGLICYAALVAFGYWQPLVDCFIDCL